MDLYFLNTSTKQGMPINTFKLSTWNTEEREIAGS